MNVWRIGSNWDGIDILPIFKKNNIVFAGKSVEQSFKNIKPNDIIAVTNGQSIIAVGKAKELIPLSIIDESYINQFDDVIAVTILPFYFKEDYPDVEFEYYDGQGKQFHQAHGNYIKQISNLFNKLNALKMQKEILSLLEYKYQIILQGPPGTGKTRKAKEIALEMTRALTIQVSDILESLSVGQELFTSSERASFIITKILEDKLEYQRKSTLAMGLLNFTDIIQAYQNKIWLTNNIRNGSDTYSAAVAKYIYENLNADNSKLIQFHPAYTYEDFVRGITAKSTGTGIEYKTENKVLAKFAKIALGNFLESKKDINSISKEKWISDMFEEFKDIIQDELDENGKYYLTKSAHIYEIDDNVFKYTGDNWNTLFRMPFTDIIKLYILGIRERKDIKKQSEISGRSKQHATYYFNLLNKFKEFLADKKFTENENLKVPLKNFVLIIDEINRANLPAVLGELIYALEYRYDENNPKETTVESMYDIDGENTITLPPNLFIIGTMNTADRSVGHIDYAIRRRFAFVDILPDIEPVHPTVQSIFKEVSGLFIENFDEYLSAKIILPAKDTLAADFRPEDVWIGHSYFICKKENSIENISDAEAKPILANKLKYEVLPILKEYIKDGILQDNEKTQKVLQVLTQWS